MIIADKISDYRVLDTGDGMKLENWGGYLLARPDPQVACASMCGPRALSIPACSPSSRPTGSL